MRIALVNFEYPPLGGGGGVITKELAEMLSKRGHEIFVITMGYAGFPKYELNGNVSITRIFSFRKTIEHSYLLNLISFAFFSLPSIYSICKKYKIDIINSHFSIPSGIPCVIVSKMLGIPLVTSAMGADIFDPTRFSTARKFLNIMNSYILNNSSKVVCLSSDMKERTLPLTKNSIDIIPYGIHREKFYTKNGNFLKEKLGIRNENVILTVARLVKRKSLDIALQSIALLKERGHDIKYIIVGDGPEMENLVRLASKLNIGDKVIFTGRASDEELPLYYSASDIFLLPSLHEAFGIVLLEAMIYGMPVVVSNVGGMKDIVRNGKNGFLITQGDSHEFANKIELLISNKKIRKEMTNYSITIIKEEYDISKMIDTYEKLFEKILKR